MGMSIGKAAMPRKDIKFGFPNEKVTFNGDYICRFDGFAEVAINNFHEFIIWRFLDDPKGNIHRANCDGLLHALALIHNLLQEHNITLPTTVTQSPTTQNVSLIETVGLMEKLNEE